MNLKTSSVSILLISVLFVLSCRNEMDETNNILWEELSPLPEAVTNNAVAVAEVNGTVFIYSFMGLSVGKTFRDVHSKAFKYNAALDEWERIADVPGDSGRLAGTAVTVDDSIYIFGGYTVAEDGSEKSVPDVYRLDPETDSYTLITQMPVPVDDAVSLVFKDRYIYLISGWHNDNNVENVQLFDIQTGSWQQATPYPGPPVFGHAGGISGNIMVISDGVKVVPQGEDGRTFEMSDESWMGTVNPDSLTEIRWTRLPQHPGTSRYRMAAAGADGRVIFAGGSSNPYNYNGIGYNGKPSPPDSVIFAYSLKDSSWQKLAAAPVPTMDHRSLLKIDDWYYIIGGMMESQQLSDNVFRFKLKGH